MTEKYNIVLEGNILPGNEKEQVLPKAGKLLKLDIEKINSLLDGKHRTIKKGLDQEKARHYIQTISKAGIACHLEPGDPDEKNQESVSREKVPVSDTPSQNKCPKCGFDLSTDPSLTKTDECPKCGIVLSKFTAESSLTEGMPPDQTETTPKIADFKPEYLDAPNVLKSTAAIASLVVPSVIYWLCFPILAVLMSWNAKFVLLSVGLSLIISLLYFVIFPNTKGGTWAQRFLNIEVIRADDEKDMALVTWFIRAVSQWIYLAPLVLMVFLVVLIRKQPSETDIAVCTLLWITAVFFMLPWKKTRSIPDRLSGTRQVIKSNSNTPHQGSLWIIILICFFLSIGGHRLGVYLVTPPSEADQLNAMIKGNHIILQQVCEYQETHLKKYGNYQEEPFALIERCSSIQNPRNSGLLRVASNSILFIEITDEGFLCALPMPNQPGNYLVYTQAGDQGIQEGDFNYFSRRLHGNEEESDTNL